MWERNLNGLLAVILSLIVGGGLTMQFGYHEVPCALCLLQRLGMLSVAAGALMNVRFGPRKMFYGLSLLGAIFGGFVALRHIALHVCPDFKKFGEPFMGISLYVWSFFTFASSLVFITLMLLIFSGKRDEVESPKLNWWGHFAFALVFLIAVANIFASIWVCGLGTC